MPPKKRTNLKKLPKGQGFAPGSELMWTEEKAVELFEAARDLVMENESISFDTQLRMEMYKAGLCEQWTITNLYYKYKSNNDIQTIYKAINDILEFRKCYDKEMVPGIAKLALHHKHKWVEKQEIDLGSTKEKPLRIKTEGKTPEELINIIRTAINE